MAWIALRPSSGQEPCADLPRVSNSSHKVPLCAVTTSRRVGSPTIARSFQIPGVLAMVPKGEFESLADKGMTVDQMRGWVSKFITTSPAMHNANWRTQNAALARSFEVFVAKKDSWAKAQDAFGKNDFKSAVGALRMISNIDPNDHCAKLNLASALSSSGDHAAAIAMLDSVTETWAGETTRSARWSMPWSGIRHTTRRSRR